MDRALEREVEILEEELENGEISRDEFLKAISELKKDYYEHCYYDELNAR